MGKTFTMRMQGIEGVLKNIDRLGESAFATMVDQELSVSANNVASEARLLVPTRKGKLKASIHTDTSVRLRKAVIAGAKYAAFVHFGTGRNVFKGSSYNHTPEERRYARQFFVSGKGRMYAHPYLFPPFHREIPKLKQRIAKRMFSI